MFQQITLVGYLGSDPVMRFTPAGKSVTNFSMATSNSYKDAQGNKIDDTTWWRVSVWGAQAESCNQYLKKGRPVLVICRMNQDKATGGPKIFEKNDGSAGAAYEVNAFNVRFLPSGAPIVSDEAPVATEDAIPF